MLSSAIPIYNYLIDGLEDYCDNSDSSSDVVIAVKAGIQKLERYYAKTDDTTMYTVATGKLNIKLSFFLKCCLLLNNSIYIVLDPRLKLGYYEDHEWKQEFIQFAKETVINIYNTKYGPYDRLEDDVAENSGLFNHIFGK